MSPRDAFFAAHERVPAAQAIGRIAAETAVPYPPGIPALAPGERIQADVLKALHAEVAGGTRVAYCGDPTLATHTGRQRISATLAAGFSNLIVRVGSSFSSLPSRIS